MRAEKNGFGCGIHGVDAKAATPAVIKELKDLLYKNRLVVLKDQTVSEQEYCDFANRFGLPVPYLQDELSSPRSSADLRLVQCQEGRQADRRCAHRRLLALGHVF